MDLRQPRLPNFTGEFSLDAELPAWSLRPTSELPAKPERHSVAPRPSVCPRPARRRPPAAQQRPRTRAPRRQTPAAQATHRAPRPTGPEQALAADLLQRYMPLVRQIVGGFQRKLPRNVLRDDLLAAGMSGLWDAIRRQGTDRNDSFDWYVRVRIRGAILDELRAQDWLPRRARASANEAADTGDTSVVRPSVVRFDDVGAWEHGRYLSSHDSNSETAVEAKFTRETLARAVDLLPSRERHIVAMHYFKGVKFKDLGQQLGVSEPRISQLHSRAMKRLRAMIDASPC
jgi:RNA polymerase sigma factor FliA